MPFLLLSKLLCDNISNQLRQLCMLRRSQVNKITAVLRRDLRPVRKQTMVLLRELSELLGNLRYHLRTVCVKHAVKCAALDISHARRRNQQNLRSNTGEALRSVSPSYPHIFSINRS